MRGCRARPSSARLSGSAAKAERPRAVARAHPDAGGRGPRAAGERAAPAPAGEKRGARFPGDGGRRRAGVRWLSVKGDGPRRGTALAAARPGRSARAAVGRPAPGDPRRSRQGPGVGCPWAIRGSVCAAPNGGRLGRSVAAAQDGRCLPGAIGSRHAASAPAAAWLARSPQPHGRRRPLCVLRRSWRLALSAGLFQGRGGA